MSTLIVTGSPREGMFSDRMAAMLSSMTGDAVHHLRGKNIGPCHACGYCKEINPGNCIQKDEMKAFYKEIAKADTIAIFSPIYWWQVTAQTKLFIDRLYALDGDLWKEKKFIIVVNGGADDDDKEFELLHDIFDEMFSFCGSEYHFLGIGTKDEKDFTEKEARIKEFLADAIKE
ncbi:MAG: flavodoxin family protein [Spirochaetales bacterium]|nr:flavodoxin family protein [Candidatus Physcosoma equi]